VAAFAHYCDPDKFPWAGEAEEPLNLGMVTDHRGNVERWLGLVFGLLLTKRLDHLNLVTRPDDVNVVFRGRPINVMLTLRDVDLFTASALAIDLGGLSPLELPAPLAPVLTPPGGPPPTQPAPTPPQDTIAQVTTLRDTLSTPSPVITSPSENVVNPPIDENGVKVLSILKDKSPMLQKNVDIEANVDLSKQTVGRLVTELIDKRLVHRPEGERKGVTITECGIALLDRIRKSSAVHP
jgi:predicted transcriptional regulator